MTFFGAFGILWKNKMIKDVTKEDLYSIILNHFL